MCALPSLPSVFGGGKRTFETACALPSTDTHSGLFNKRQKIEEEEEEEDTEMGDGDEKKKPKKKTQWKQRTFAGFDEVPKKPEEPPPPPSSSSGLSVADRRRIEKQAIKVAEGEMKLRSSTHSQLLQPWRKAADVVKLLRTRYEVVNFDAPIVDKDIVARVEWIQRFYLPHPKTSHDWSLVAFWLGGRLKPNPEALRKADYRELRCNNDMRFLGTLPDWIAEFQRIHPDVDIKKPVDKKWKRRLDWIDENFSTKNVFLQQSIKLGMNWDWTRLVLDHVGQLEPLDAVIQGFRIGAKTVQQLPSFGDRRFDNKEIIASIQSFLPGADRVRLQFRLSKAPHVLSHPGCAAKWTTFNICANSPIVPHIVSHQGAVAIRTMQDVFFRASNAELGCVAALETAAGRDDLEALLLPGTPDERREGHATNERKQILAAEDEKQFWSRCKSAAVLFQQFANSAPGWDRIEAFVLSDEQRIDILALITSSLHGSTTPMLDAKLGKIKDNYLVRCISGHVPPHKIQTFLLDRDEHGVLDMWMEYRPVSKIGWTQVRDWRVDWTKYPDETEKESVVYWTSQDNKQRVLFAFYPQRRLLFRSSDHGTSAFLSFVLDPKQRKERPKEFVKHHKWWTNALPKWRPVYDRKTKPADMIGKAFRVKAVKESVEELIV
jgi:hypothetical protein